MVGKNMQKFYFRNFITTLLSEFDYNISIVITASVDMSVMIPLSKHIQIPSHTFLLGLQSILHLCLSTFKEFEGEWESWQFLLEEHQKLVLIS